MRWRKWRLASTSSSTAPSAEYRHVLGSLNVNGNGDTCSYSQIRQILSSTTGTTKTEPSVFICLQCTATVQSIVLVAAAQRHKHSLRE